MTHWIRRAAGAAVLGAGLAGTSPAAAQDDALPESVAGPYLEYETAMQAGDLDAALAAAASTLEAAEDARVDRGLIGILTENYARLLAASGSYAEASERWEDAARLADRNGDPALNRAWAWYNAAATARRADATENVIDRADRAVDAVDEVETLDGQAAMVAGEVYSLAATVLFERGYLWRAAHPSQRALEVFEVQPRQPDAVYAMMHLIRSLSRFVADDDHEAAFHMHMAADIASSLDETSDLARRTRAVAHYFSDRSEEPIAPLLEANALHVERFAESADESEATEIERPEGWHDASILHREQPVYPAEIAARNIEGVLVVQFAVDESGRVADPEVLVEFPGGAFQDAALEAMEAWRYEPATINGSPVRREGVLTHFTFRLVDPEDRRRMGRY